MSVAALECQHCDGPIELEDTEEANGEARCGLCGSRHAWHIPSAISEDGQTLVRVARWWCPHGIVDHQACTPCEVLYAGAGR